MWLFTTIGYFSISDAPGEHSVRVTAVCRSHLDAFFAAAGVAGAEVQEALDGNCWAVLPRSCVQRAVGALLDRVRFPDLPEFIKHAVHHADATEVEYLGALQRVQAFTYAMHRRAVGGQATH